MKKIRMVVIVPLIILVAIFTASYIYVWNFWWPAKQAKIIQGLATFEFPYRDYSLAELNTMYPQIKNADIPTRITPEQTYAKFREALKTNNLELAVEQLYREGGKRYQENKVILEKSHEKGEFKIAYKQYPEKIEKQSMSEALAAYYYFRVDNGKEVKTHIGFVKNAYGDWKMDSL